METGYYTVAAITIIVVMGSLGWFLGWALVKLLRSRLIAMLAMLLITALIVVFELHWIEVGGRHASWGRGIVWLFALLPGTVIFFGSGLAGARDS